jgi:RNA polymerase-binding transcription factor DksA
MRLEGAPVTDVDMEKIAADLAGVEIALARLDDGTYWTCELTGEELPDALLASDPVARRLPPPPSREPPS